MKDPREFRLHGIHVLTHDHDILLNPLENRDMTDIDMLKLLQVVHDLPQRNALEVQIKRNGNRVWIRPHVLKPLNLGVPTVTTRHALETLNFASVAPVLPTPLLNMCRTAVRTLSLVRACDLKRKVQVLRCDLLTEIAGEEAAIDVFTGNLPVNEVWALTSPIHSLTNDKIRAVA
jgi:hypothetical protein